MKFKKNKIGFLIVILFIIIGIGIYSLSYFNSKVAISNLSLARNTSFGIKFPFPQRVMENINSGRNFEDLSKFEKDFIEAYNNHAKLKGKDSEAFFNYNNGITLNISQPTWSSTWYVRFEIRYIKC